MKSPMKFPSSRNNFFLLTYILLAASCNGQGQNSAKQSSTKNQSVTEHEYFFSNDTLTQKANIIFTNTNQILFTVTTTNNKRRLESTFSNTAIAKSIQSADDVQAYEDELESDMYPAKEYIHSKQCYITFGIDTKTNARLFIVEAEDCKKLHNPYCPFGSLGTLRKK